MVRRLLLGCGSIGHAVIEALAAQPGSLRVIDADESRVETLRGEGILADRGDPTDLALLQAAETTPDLVLIASDDGQRNLRAARVAHSAFPNAYLVAYTGPDPEQGTRTALSGQADAVVDHPDSLARAVLDAVDLRTGGEGWALKSVLESIDGRLGVFMHNDPDPDAIGSAIALRDVAIDLGLDAEACYFGEIAHQENRALVNLLDLDLTHLAADTYDPADFAGVALVDHSRPGVNDSLPRDTDVDVVIDHHPPRGPVDATHVDLRTDVGATSTLLVDYLEELGLEFTDRVATALLYGIRVDTRDFGRDITASDFEAASVLLEAANMDVLERVESPSVTGDTVDTIARAIKGYHRAGEFLISNVGQIGNRDALAQAADQLLEMEGVTLTAVFGFMGNGAYVSGRTRGASVDIGETMRRAFEGMGSAGGHADMAGAQLSAGILEDVRADDEPIEDVFSEVIVGRLFEELGVGDVPVANTADSLPT